MAPLHLLVARSKERVEVLMILAVEGVPASVGEAREVSWVEEDVEDDPPMEQLCDDTQTPAPDKIMV